MGSIVITYASICVVVKVAKSNYSEPKVLGVVLLKIVKYLPLHSKKRE